MESSIVIGMDPPVHKNCGWAVVGLEDSKLKLYEKFTQVLDHDKGNVILEEVYGTLEGLILKYKPTALSMERQQGTGFAFGRAKLNEFVGVAKLCALRHGIKVVEVSPAHMKMIIAGHGKAPKDYIMDNVVETFDLDDAGAEHECDAVAFGINYFIDNGWAGYVVTAPYSKKQAKADLAAKKARKLKREKRKKEREEAAARAENQKVSDAPPLNP